MKVFIQFFKDSIEEVTTGSKVYHLWMAFLTLVMLIGAYCYYIQVDQDNQKL